MKYKRKKQTKMIVLFALLFLVLITITLTQNKHTQSEIDTILTNQYYSYLPSGAKEYIREYYENTGNVLLTEKNKEDNKPYLNPEFVNYLELTEEEKQEEAIIPIATVIDYISEDYVEASQPTSYDSRNVNGKNYITPVRNQGGLGLCWAFSSAETAETYLLKTQNQTYTSNSQLFSERQIDYATATDGINNYDSEYVNFLDRTLGDGGNFFISSLAMGSGVSLVDYNSFKEYNDKDKEKMELDEVLRYEDSLYELNDSILIPQMNYHASTNTLTSTEQNARTSYLNEVKEYIQTYGSAYVTTYMSDSCYYTDSKANNTVIDVYNCSLSNGHAMQIIGWDDNIEYSYCADTQVHKTNTSNCNNVVNGKGVWILRNSWGNEIPYPYLTYDSMYTSISFIKNMTLSTNKTWDNNYLIGEENDTVMNTTYPLENTNIKGEEKLNKVKFIATSLNVTYNVEVTTSTGSKVTQSVTPGTAGMVTVSFPTTPTINKDSSIKISSYGYYADKIIVLTKNKDLSPYISLEDNNNITISDNTKRIYSITKNIPSGSTITYKLFDSKNNNITSKITVTNNVSVENNTNPLFTFESSLENGSYTLKAYYNNQELSSININVNRMLGSGTVTNPYIITNPTHLYQIKNDLGGYYVLGNDIDMTDVTRNGGEYSNPAEYNLGDHGWMPIDGFHGTLDGNGHKIVGLYQKTYLYDDETGAYSKIIRKLNGESHNVSGLFATAYGNVTIKNLTLEDFDISCYEYCGTLISWYQWSYPDTDWTDTNEYSLTIENVAIKNSTISNLGRSGMGGLLGYIAGNSYSTLNLNNIYLDNTVHTKGIGAYVIDNIANFSEINISNIQLLGNIDGIQEENSGGIVRYMTSSANINIENIFSSLYNSNLGGTIGGKVWIHNSLNLKNINIIKIPGRELFYRNDNTDNLTTSDINIYDYGTTTNNLTKTYNYSTWVDFNKNWITNSIDGIDRYPILKFVDFEYTTIDDIEIQIDNSTYTNIYELIHPKTESAQRIIYNVIDESIAEIDSDGNIIPKAIGETYIHIESLYDGYNKNVPLKVTGNYYILKFDGNTGNGTMNNQFVPLSDTTKINKNIFTKTGYIFKNWNTKVDGTGTSYTDEQSIKSLASIGSTITLYAIWEPITYTIEYNSNGGNGSISSQTVTYDETITIKENMFTKTDYNFKNWNTKSDGTGTSYNSLQTVKNLTSENNKKITLYAQWSSNYYFTITNYRINDSYNYIDLINYNTNLNSFKSHFNTNYILDIDMKGYSYISTGSKTRLYKGGTLYKEYTNIVRGDINGDAKISALDYVMVKNHIMGSNRINNTITELAADANNDGKISALDYVQIKNIIMGG